LLRLLKAILLHLGTCGLPTHLPQHNLINNVQRKSNALITAIPSYHTKVEKATPDTHPEERAGGKKKIRPKFPPTTSTPRGPSTVPKKSKTPSLKRFKDLKKNHKDDSTKNFNRD
jgi:hypothetical protein